MICQEKLIAAAPESTRDLSLGLKKLMSRVRETDRNEGGQKRCRIMVIEVRIIDR